jgi:hypothetical protein
VSSQIGIGPPIILDDCLLQVGHSKSSHRPRFPEILWHVQNLQLLRISSSDKTISGSSQSAVILPMPTCVSSNHHKSSPVYRFSVYPCSGFKSNTIEKELHWSLDVCFGEDQSRVRIGNAAENLSRVRRLALTLLKQERTAKVGIKAKRLMAGWNENYLLKVLKI